MNVFELNLDGLVGPTHNYAGLAPGNMASTTNAQSISNPKAAALQGLQKMRLLHQLGLKQGVLPPHQRPNLSLLRQLGFTGKPNEQIQQAHRIAPELLNASYSASSMWTANAATVSSSLDTEDNKVHFTAANLISNLHRQQEAVFSHQIFQYLFANADYFRHHSLLPQSTTTGDEGAANHNRLCKSHAHPGINLFVYGKKGLGNGTGPVRYPARQTLEASEAIARKHRLIKEKVIFACQTPDAIDKGVFHNDVIAVANESVLLIHQDAFVNQTQVLSELQEKANFPLTIIELTNEQLLVEEAVQTYLFNSQLLTLPQQSMILIAPTECQQHPKVEHCIEALIASSENPIQAVHYLDLKQSMRNGGGPACLRLRIPLTEEELNAMHQGILLDDALLLRLEQWVEKHYRDRLSADDFLDSKFIDENYQALDELSQILQLGSIYPFQREINS